MAGAADGNFSFSADQRVVAFLRSTLSHPYEVFISNATFTSTRRLTSTNPRLDSLALADVRDVRWRSRDGTIVTGLLALPRNFEASRPLPTVAYLHGGPAWYFSYAFTPHGALPKAAQTEMLPISVMTGRGFAVFMPNPRGSIGFGKPFRLAVVSDWGGVDLDDVMSGLDSLVADGTVDGARIGVAGSSYGATLAALAITRTKRFRAAVMHAGIIDPAAAFGESDAPDLFQSYFGGPPWERAAVYAARTATFHAHQITTPVLLLHGTADRRVPVTQSRQFYRALRRQKKPVTLVTYTDQGHGFNRPSAARDAMTRTVEFLDAALR